jgi:predicted helicase
VIQEHYEAPVSRRGIFNYVYGLLHHPGYRSRYAANLKRDLPRIPLVGNLDTFRAMATGGKKLIGFHFNYEGKKEYRLKRRENPDVKLDWRVEVMRLSRDGKAIYYNDFLTLTGVPPEVFDYRLGNRSALEWVIDQYRA